MLTLPILIVSAILLCFSVFLAENEYLADNIIEYQHYNICGNLYYPVVDAKLCKADIHDDPLNQQCEYSAAVEFSALSDDILQTLCVGLKYPQLVCDVGECNCTYP